VLAHPADAEAVGDMAKVEAVHFAAELEDLARYRLHIKGEVRERPWERDAPERFREERHVWLMPQPVITAPRPSSLNCSNASSSSIAVFQAFGLYPTTFNAAGTALPMCLGRTRAPQERSSGKPAARVQRTPPTSSTSCDCAFEPLISRSTTNREVMPFSSSTGATSGVRRPSLASMRSPRARAACSAGVGNGGAALVAAMVDSS